ncbi:hypothetical protein GW7_00079 [Heterocephalus glaber]|uniref:Uncharacterized protein n=1 Tax=Heterocephalus glaber TaxID=10181 RepID=G5ALD5_HETGA|nr:hypothetical protein GW7_00079 [Heterocephalus glaber]
MFFLESSNKSQENPLAGLGGGAQVLTRDGCCSHQGTSELCCELHFLAPVQIPQPESASGPSFPVWLYPTRMQPQPGTFGPGVTGVH